MLRGDRRARDIPSSQHQSPPTLHLVVKRNYATGRAPFAKTNVDSHDRRDPPEEAGPRLALHRLVEPLDLDERAALVGHVRRDSIRVERLDWRQEQGRHPADWARARWGGGSQAGRGRGGDIRRSGGRGKKCGGRVRVSGGKVGTWMIKAKKWTNLWLQKRKCIHVVNSGSFKMWIYAQFVGWAQLTLTAHFQFCRSQYFKVCLERARVGGQILVRCELSRVDKD